MAQWMTIPDIICFFYSTRMDVKRVKLRNYLGSDMDLNTLSLRKFEDGGPGSAK
jgi:hypothetical protein